jgi:hypothetical protein
MGSFVYLVLLFIDLFPLSPVTGAEDPDDVAPHCESHCQNTATDPSDTVIPRLFTAMAYILRNDTRMVEKRLLCNCERYTMLLLVLSVFRPIPLESGPLHDSSIPLTA